MDIPLWLAFVAASTVLLIIPGPTVLMVLSYGLGQGRRVAVACAAGVALGDGIAMTASLLGLGAVVMASATLFTVLKWIGAGYLVWMGVKLWRSAGAMTLGRVPSHADIPARAVFGHATMVTSLNPKSIAFFIAFVPQFIDTSAPLPAQFVVLVTTFVTLATLNAFVLALLAARLRDGLRRPPVLQAIARTGGAAMIAMGALTALTRRTA
ncbi:MAG: LysE family translocator [Jannaschia sp.]